MADDDARLHILEREAARTEAMLHADMAALSALVSEDYLHVESSGKVRTKAEFLAALSEIQFESFVIDENQVRVFGGVAVATGRYHNAIRTEQGVRPVKHARHVRLYVWDGARWLNTVHQATEIRG